jgi:hypothetical protein
LWLLASTSMSATERLISNDQGICTHDSHATYQGTHEPD